MFQKLLKKVDSVEWYLAVPLLQLRLCYLDQCVAQGLAHRTIQEIARNQVAAVELLSLENSGPIPAADVEAAGERWALGRGVQPGGKRQRSFVSGTLRWLRGPK